MPGWPFRSRDASPVKKWADGVAETTLEDGLNYEEKTQFPPLQGGPANETPTTSTAVDSTLPAPATQGDVRERYSVASTKRRKKRARYNKLGQLWAEFKSRIGSGSAPSSSSINDQTAADQSYTHRIENADDDEEELDEVVVDRIWSDEFHTTLSHHSDHDYTLPNKPRSNNNASGNTDNDSMTHEDYSHPSWFQIVCNRIAQGFMAVFSSSFADERKERHYAREDWYVKRPLAILTSLWWIANWVLGCIFVNITDNKLGYPDYIFYYAIAPVLSIPLPLMVIYDWPRDRQYLYQAFLTVSIWCWSFYHVIYINVCGLYTGGDCHGRDFQAIFYYTTAMQTIGFFGLKLNRFPAAIGALAYLLLASISIIPDKTSWARSMINFFAYHSFLIYVSYMREVSDRRLYTLRDQVKNQYKATQRAQMNERKASDSKRRLTSYVFHDKSQVRVPLNTALLAVQNMAASGTVAKDQEIEFNALSGSLSMMSKVLNDVLDFNRMDSGKFESASRPYAFHQVMRSLFIPLQLATNARGLEFETDLDPNIDRLARALAYEAMGETPEHIRAHIEGHPDVDGIVVGDEARLRQIITNLASNACKFTPAGGRLTITTKLARPRFLENEDPLDFVFPLPEGKAAVTMGGGELKEKISAQRPLSADYLSQHDFNTRNEKTPLEMIVVRIEVTDTGCGIRPKDMMNSKLFSAFNQTEQGIQQGGKGTGLGLALVRQIVKLTGGRLGVKSKIGQGSTFWVELPLGVGRKTFPASGPPATLETSSPPSDASGILAKELAKRQNHGLFDTPLNDPLAVAVDTAAFAAMRAELDPLKDASHSKLETTGNDNERHTKRSSKATSRTERPSNDPSPSRVESDVATPKARHPLHETETIPLDDLDFSSSPHDQTPTPGHDKPPSRSNRPNYVPLPSPPTFSDTGQLLEKQPPTTTSTVASSASSYSPLAAFDSSFAHCGSPSSSTAAVNIVPGLNVLVVDDDPLTRTLMTRILTRLGCQVTTAENGEMAIDIIMGVKGLSGLTPSTDSSKQLGPILEQPKKPPELLPSPGSGMSDGLAPDEHKFAVVFLDNQMPVMSGVRAVERLRQLGRTDFIVGVTGNALLSDQQEYLEAGVDRVLTKPVLERSLREILNVAEERRKSLLKETPTDSPGAPSSS